MCCSHITIYIPEPWFFGKGKQKHVLFSENFSILQVYLLSFSNFRRKYFMYKREEWCWLVGCVVQCIPANSTQLWKCIEDWGLTNSMNIKMKCISVSSYPTSFEKLLWSFMYQSKILFEDPNPVTKSNDEYLCMLKFKMTHFDIRWLQYFQYFKNFYALPAVFLNTCLLLHSLKAMLNCYFPSIFTCLLFFILKQN